MPESLALGAFVLGAVLLLLSLINGGFKIFGAEVSGTTGTAGRLVAFVAGLIFLIVGFSYTAEPSSTPLPPPPVIPPSPPVAFPSGHFMQGCGCWGGPSPVLIAFEPRCQSGQVRLDWCTSACMSGGVQYAYVCQ